MVLSIRSGSGASPNLPARRRAPRGAGAVVLRAMAGFAALVALLFFAIPVQADEIEPESVPAPQAEPEPEPEPVPVPDVVSEEEEFSEPAWIPSLDVGFEGFSYDVDTTIVNFPGVNPVSETQVESVNQLVFRIGGELMGPMFEDLPGRPRLFVQGGVGFSTFADELFERDDPSLLNQPETNIDTYLSQGAGENDFPSDFEGQGSRLDASLQDPSWYAGLGIAFSVRTSGGMLFYIKPSVQYSLEKIDFGGKLTTVEETSPPGTVDPDPCGADVFVPPPPPPPPPRPPCAPAHSRSTGAKPVPAPPITASVRASKSLWRSGRLARSGFRSSRRSEPSGWSAVRRPASRIPTVSRATASNETILSSEAGPESD